MWTARTAVSTQVIPSRYGLFEIVAVLPHAWWSKPCNCKHLSDVVTFLFSEQLVLRWFHLFDHERRVHFFFKSICVEMRFHPFTLSKEHPSPPRVISITFSKIKFLAFVTLPSGRLGLSEHWKYKTLVVGSHLSVIFSRLLGLKWIFCINVKKGNKSRLPCCTAGSHTVLMILLLRYWPVPITGTAQSSCPPCCQTQCKHRQGRHQFASDASERI